MRYLEIVKADNNRDHSVTSSKENYDRRCREMGRELRELLNCIDLRVMKDEDLAKHIIRTIKDYNAREAPSEKLRSIMYNDPIETARDQLELMKTHAEIGQIKAKAVRDLSDVGHDSNR